jgi:hypothetical protein
MKEKLSVMIISEYAIILFIYKISHWDTACCYRAKEFFTKANQAAAFGRRARGRDTGNYFEGCPIGRIHALRP